MPPAVLWVPLQALGALPVLVLVPAELAEQQPVEQGAEPLLQVAHRMPLQVVGQVVQPVAKDPLEEGSAEHRSLVQSRVQEVVNPERQQEAYPAPKEHRPSYRQVSSARPLRSKSTSAVCPVPMNT